MQYLGQYSPFPTNKKVAEFSDLFLLSDILRTYFTWGSEVFILRETATGFPDKFNNAFLLAIFGQFLTDANII